MMKNVSYEEARHAINSKEIEQLNTKKKHTSGYIGKISGSILFALLLCLPAINYYPIYPTIACILLGGLLIKYIDLKPISKVTNYNLVLYLIWQTATIFFMIVFLRVEADRYHLIPLVYIIWGYGGSILLIRARVNTYVKEIFETTAKSGKKVFSNIITKILGAFLVLAVIAVLFYRGNKWWLMNMNAAVGNSSFLEYVVWGIGLLILLIGFTLLPTLLFSPSQYVKARVIGKYAEEFQKSYEFTENEWYGEK
ncbi:hypothetical protein FPV71_10745 [Listeria monocytogenes]|nr:hypothetical protein [Listeria monocytogenes]EAD3257078.1 hypothetical protein [Listeria monocytogenes]EAD8645548.1 hypothetical protein [Listeria monocytogenes]EAF3627439.1 hypothetical protein [Listeria monocytogenes]EAF4064547.1 hypothetical protein [Listeria monocytogenes]